MNRVFRCWLSAISLFLMLIVAPPWTLGSGLTDPDQERAKLFEQTQSHLHRGRKKAALKTMKRYVALGAQPNVNDLYNGFLVAAEAKSCTDMYLFALGHDRAAGLARSPKAFAKGLKDCAKRLRIVHPISFSANVEESNVLINGIWVAQLPTSEIKLPSGEMTIKITHPDYDPYVITRRINKRARPEVKAYLTRKKTFGTLLITTNPPGARVTLAGKDIGETPVGPLTLETGKHFVELNLEGFDRFIRNVKIRRGEETLFDATLEKKASAP